MTELINFLTSEEIIMVYIVAFIACALYFIIHLIDKYYYKRKLRQNTRELNRLVENINYELSKEREEEIVNVKEEVPEEAVYVEPVLIEDPIFDEAEIVPIVDLTEKDEEVVEVNEVENLDMSVEDAISETSFQQEAVEEPKMVEEVLDYTSPEPNQTEAQAELKRLTEALEQAEEVTKNIDLTSYEEMQEKEAIISLDELLKRSKEMYESNELTQYADEGNEPISLEDLERKVKESLSQEAVEEPVLIKDIASVTDDIEVIEPEIVKTEEVKTMVLDDFYTISSKEAKESKTAYKQFKSMPVISPVYGIEKKATTSDLELENTANYEKLDEEIKKTNEFLMTLKDLQKNLD